VLLLLVVVLYLRVNGPTTQRNVDLLMASTTQGPDTQDRVTEETGFLETRVMIPRPRGIMPPFPAISLPPPEGEIANLGNTSNQAEAKGTENAGPSSSSVQPSTTMTSKSSAGDAGPSTSSVEARAKAMMKKLSEQEALMDKLGLPDSPLPPTLRDTINRLELEKSGKITKPSRTLNTEIKNFKKNCRKGNSTNCGCPTCYTRSLAVEGPPNVT